jgi:hypothetical protein
VSDTDNNAAPETPAGDGRGSNGRFLPGNKAGKGNPHNQKAQAIRAALFDAVDPQDIRAAVLAVMEMAKAGDLRALAEVLDRTIGRPIPQDVEERLAALEETIAERRGSWT